jgi:DNA-binding NarL/FixJ family response regulator
VGQLLSDIRILLVDDHRVLRDGLKTWLEQEADMIVQGTAGTAVEGLVKAKGCAVDVALIDLSLPDHDGLWLIERLKEEAPHVAMIVLSMHDDEETVLKVLKAGANGYMTKSADPQEVLVAIRAVREGRSYVQKEIAPYLIGALRQQADTSDGQLKLDEREREILRRAARGQSNQKIADDLFVSVSTIKASLRTVFRKLDVSTRTEAVLEAMRRGFIEDPTSSV